MGSFCLENVLIAQGCGTSSSSSESTPIRSSSGAERALVPMVPERVSVSRDTLTLSRVFIDASIQGMSRVSSLRWSFFLFSGILSKNLKIKKKLWCRIVQRCKFKLNLTYQCKTVIDVFFFSYQFSITTLNNIALRFISHT